MAGRRYNDDENKLNYKKILAVIIFFIVVIMFVIGIKTLITTGIDSSSGKITTIYYLPYCSNDKWGIINSNGNVVISAQYDEMPVVPNDTQAIFVCTYDVDYENETYKTKVVNEKNENIITGYDNVNFIDNIDSKGKLVFIDNLLKVQKDGKYGLVDLKGKEVLEVQYDEISVLDGVDNSLLIKKDGKLGLCDYSGNVIIATEYKDIKAIGSNYKNGYITVSDSSLYGIIDFNKSVVFENQYLDIKPIYSYNKYAVKLDDAYIIIDKNGKTLLDKSFEDVRDINDENIVYVQNGKMGVINTSLENKIPVEYEDLKSMGSNYYIAKKNGSYGVIDINNEVQIDFKYTDVKYENASGIVIAKTTQNQYDIYDSTMVLKLTVNDIETRDTYMTVLIGNEFKYYNFKFEEKDIKSILANKDFYSDSKNGKYGFVNSNGKVIVNYKYDEVTELNKYGYAGIKLDGLWGAVNAKGEVVLEPRYNLDNYSEIDFIGKWHKGLGAEYYTDM